MTSFLATLLAALVLAEPAGALSVSLDVPYLPQTEAMCGGAAVAMVLRYWGDRHADVEQFAPLVDRKAGGIANDVLTDAVRARGWQARSFSASVETVRDRLAAGQPMILLLEEGPGRYHYVVAVGVDEEHVEVHDPTRGPSRRLALDDLQRAWKASNFWALLVLPAASEASDLEGTSLSPGGVRVPDPSVAGPPSTPTPCERLLADAIDDIGRRGLGDADEILAVVRGRCPDAAGPIAELAGVRFAERRWHEAIQLAEDASRRDPSSEYAWDVLGSSRFMDNDLPGALEAWNRIGKPRLDSIAIEGLEHTQYAIVAQALGLRPNAVLTADAYRLAARRLQQLPTRLSDRISFRPAADGFATLNVAVAERPPRPRGTFEWTAAGVQAMVDREASARIPGGTGQGEVWDVSWRWWTDRPRVAMGFAAPGGGRLRGVWRVDGFVETQHYGTDTAGVVRERRVHGGVTLTDWISDRLRYELSVGLDSWDGRRLASIGGTIDRRFLDDHLALSGSTSFWAPVGGGRPVQSAGAHAAYWSSREPRGIVHHAWFGVETVSSAAPLALWPGAGDGHARPMLVRAHPLLHEGVIEGPVFGRRTTALNLESQRWFGRSALVRTGAAVFIDAAHAAQRLASADGGAFHVDAGLGLRLRLRQSQGTLRVDYARGLRDGANRLTLGWQL